MNKIPVIIDCDPGYDDALALLLAIGTELIDVKAITTVAGNVGIENTYNNARRICKLFNQSIPIGKGASHPIIREFQSAKNVHSTTGMSGVRLPDVEIKEIDKTAIDVMKEVLESSKTKVKLILIGPLTNVAILFLAYPKLKEKVEEIVIMGGASVGGNVTYSAEFNIYVDAEAAKIIFESGIPIVMAGLDVTNDFQIEEKEFDYYKGLGRAGEFTYEALTEYYKFYKTLGPMFKGPALHDMLPVAYIINQALFEGTKYHVEIECKSELTYGQTVVDFLGQNSNKNVKVLTSCNKSGVLDLFYEAIEKLNHMV